MIWLLEHLIHLRDRLPEFFGLAMVVNTPPSWRQIGAQIVVGLVIAIVAGSAGGYIAIQIDQAVQESRLNELERRMAKTEDRQYGHEINGAIHYYGGRP